MPGSVPCPSHALSHFSQPPWEESSICPHFTDEDIESQPGYVISMEVMIRISGVAACQLLPELTGEESKPGSLRAEPSEISRGSTWYREASFCPVESISHSTCHPPRDTIRRK